MTIFLNASIHAVERTTEFIVRSAGGEFRAAALVVATGGLSIPKIGATSFGYDLARQFGLAIRDPRPGLVPLTLSEEDRSQYCDLAGVSAEVIASCDGQQFREKMLITHRGLSGPAILQISSYWKAAKAAADPHRSCARKRNHRGVSAIQTRQETRTRFAPNCESFCPIASPTAGSKSTLQRRGQIMRCQLWKSRSTRGRSHRPAPRATKKPKSPAGGVDTGELSAKTMESHKVPGLYFIGEVVDVTGHLGGFNFQWAWASGAAAGRAL